MLVGGAWQQNVAAQLIPRAQRGEDDRLSEQLALTVAVLESPAEPTKVVVGSRFQLARVPSAGEVTARLFAGAFALGRRARVHGNLKVFIGCSLRQSYGFLAVAIAVRSYQRLR